MCKLFGTSDKGDEPVRTTWFGMNQPRPRLPHYLRAPKRLKGLNEFEEPEWKGRMRWPEDDRVTFAGVVRDTLRWLAAFVIIAAIGGSAWVWFEGGETCAELFGGFKVGWC